MCGGSLDFTPLEGGGTLVTVAIPDSAVEDVCIKKDTPDAIKERSVGGVYCGALFGCAGVLAPHFLP